MGLSSSTTKVKPIYESQITGAADTLKNAYNTAAPNIADVSSQVTGLMPGLLQRYTQGDPSLNAAQGYITSTLGHDPAQNPFLDQIVSQTNNNVANTTNAKLGARGLTGGTVMQDILSRNLAQNESGLRYADYNNGKQLQAQAAGMAPGVAAGQTGLLAPYFDAANAVTMPLTAAAGYAAGTGGLLGQYTNTKQSNPWGGMLLGGLGSAMSAFCDIRLKENVRRIGQTDGGVPLYSFNYKGSNIPQIGPMAQEVAVLQPDALGGEVGGFLTVKFGELN